MVSASPVGAVRVSEMDSDFPEVLLEELHAVKKLLQFVARGRARLERMSLKAGDDEPVRAWLDAWHDDVVTIRTTVVARWLRGEISANDAVQRLREARTSPRRHRIR